MIVDKLANSDITKHEEIYELNWIHALNHLSMHKELDDYRREAEKRNNKR